VLSPTERDTAKVLTSLPPMVPAAASTWTGEGSPLKDGGTYQLGEFTTGRGRSTH